MKLFSKAGKQLRGGVALFAVALSALLGVTALVPTAALAEDITTDAPAHQKSISDQKPDGTYDLTLTVQGATEQSETKTKANVIVVLDTSGSMNYEVYTYSYEKTNWFRRDETYGLVDGSYVELYERRQLFQRSYYYYLDSDGNEVAYDGQMYRQTKQSTGQTRLDIAKSALNSLADQLIGDSDSTVNLSLETFADRGSTPSRYYSAGQAADFKKIVNNLRADGGTNWYDALNKANAKAAEDKNTPTYIIFLSDGEPTYGKNGGNGTYFEWQFFNDAVSAANNRPDNVQALYSVYTGSDAADKMNQFSNQVSGIPAFDGTDSEKLNAALKDIAQSIKKTASYKYVKIVDQLSEYVEGLGENGEVANITYKKNGVEWADAPKATVSGDKITWDLASVGELKDGDVYSMTFTIKPNQNAYDEAVKAGKATELLTNNDDGTKVYYKTIVKETGKPDQVSDEKSDGYEKPTIKVPVDTVTVTKAWANTGDAQLPASVTVQLKKNGQNYGDAFQLTKAENWTKTVIVPAGVGQLTWSVEENAVDDYVTTYSDAVTGSGTLTVTNTHKTWPVTLEGETAIKGTKTLTGHDMTSAFNFKLTAAENYGDKVSIAQGADTASVSGAKDGETKSFSFGAVTFNEAGTYKFNVTETGTAPAGYTYDTHTSAVTVDVTEKDGKLVATTSYGDGASCVFKNSYEAKPVTVDGAANFSFTKVLEGRDLKAGEFSFQIVATSNNNAPLPSETTVTNAANGTVSFGDITYTKAGVYTYEVSEVTDNLPGGVTAVTKGAKQVIVTVTDNNEGQLEASVATPEDKTFTNAYKADSTTIKALTTTKVIKATQDGVTPPALKGGDFSFTISTSNGAPLPEVTTVKNDAAGNVTFGAITFTQAGEYHYTITESGSMPGVTNDTEAKTFTVTVVDNGDGTMTATASEIAGFENTYTVEPVEYSVTADVDVAKSLEGRDLKAGEFSFQLVDGKKVVAEGTNDDKGNVSFGKLTYTSDDLGEHTYKVREVKGDLGGVTYDKSEYTVKVTVSDNHDGTLSAKASTDSVDGITFKNTYKTTPVDYSVTTDVKVSKSLEGRALNKGEFNFQLVDTDNNVVDTAFNDANGNVSFNAQKYSAAGDYTYTVKEVKGSLGGVTYDESTYTVTVKVTDKGDGTLSAKASTESGKITFNNTYSAKPAKLTSGVEVTKNLEGRDWTDDDKFTFVITPNGANNPMPSNGTTGVATKDSKTVSFNDFTFNEPGIYEYTVTEQGTDGEGVTYDTHEATVTITVVDNGKGQLVATPAVANGAFYNTYKAGTASVTFGAAKVLSGATLKDGQFSFQLKDADGNVVETAKNDANGNIKFSQEFTAAGEYKFTISEVNDHQVDVTYDTKSYDVTVTVTDNGKGQLEAKVSGAGVVFNNTYTEPKKEEKKEETKKDTKKEATPKTGDALLASEALAAIAGTGVLGVVASRIRRKK